MVKIENGCMTLSGTECQGYVWMSDRDEPQLVEGAVPELTIRLDSNPFPVEAQLVVDGESVGIRQTGGGYVVSRHRLEDFEGCPETVFAANRFKGVTGLVFYRNWREEPDPLCCGFPVLTPAEMVFVGFKKAEENGQGTL